MQPEYTALVIMTLFYLFAWVPVSVGKGKAFGTRWLASNRVPIQGKELPSWAARCDRAYSNLKDYFPAFVVAILLLGLEGKFDAGTTYAANIYVTGRIGHYISYGIGNIPGRFIFFVAAMGANIYLLMKCFI